MLFEATKLHLLNLIKFDTKVSFQNYHCFLSFFSINNFESRLNFDLEFSKVTFSNYVINTLKKINPYIIKIFFL